ncbi:hypothetical protein [Phaeobacter gallaeciensis]|nr:hypothetical protein [Phaeobacter gallaeciensis]MDE4398196.1 hypothetical protein [Phaeobacter gallaeciensis]
MKGNGSSSWPTARAARGEYTRDKGRPEAERPTLEGLAQNWMTPVANDDNKSPEAHMAMKARMKGGSRSTVTSLQVQAKMWSTPRSSDGEKGGPNQSFGAGGTPLPAQEANWPTPNSHQDTKGAQATPEAVLAREGKHQLALSDRAICFSHPARPTISAGRQLSNPRETWRRLRRYVIATHGRATWKRFAASGGKRRLNPIFVGWLMGWPPGHALSSCSATEFALWQRHMRGALSALPTASAGWIWEEPKPAEIEQLALI